MRQTNPNSVLDKREKSQNPAERKDPPQESQEWTPYAPYPFNLLRDGLHRRRWWVRLALIILIGPWFAWFTYTRLTTPPADPRPLDAPLDVSAAVNIPDPTVDRTKEIDKAINALDPGTSFTVPAPPPGMMWISGEQYAELQKGKRIKPESAQGTTFHLDVTVALNGPWIPDRRAHLAQIIKHLESQPVRDALDTIAELSDEPFCLSYGTSKNQLYGARAAVKHLVARSRYHLAENEDLEAAVRDMKAALQLADGVLDDGTIINMLVGIACHALAVSELQDWIEEVDLAGPELARIGRLLEEHFLDYRDAWKTTVEGEIRYCLGDLDREYTRSEGGEGWFVLRSLSSAPIEEDRHDVLAFLNLLSPLFAHRSRVVSTVLAWEPWLIEKINHPYAEVAAHWNRIEYESVNPALGVLDLTATYGRAQILLLRIAVEIRGTEVMTALRRYRSVHAEYPPNLEVLVPDYLPAMPIDPFSDKLLNYRLDAEKGYVLYSVGKDDKDDGGAWSREEQGPDWPIPVPWPKHHVYYEWFLVPTDQLNQPSGDESNE